MFQFDPVELKLRLGVRKAVLELRDTFNDWDICLWFACANAGLGGAMPVDRVVDDPDGVIRAARADRGSSVASWFTAKSEPAGAADTRQLSTSTRVSNT